MRGYLENGNTDGIVENLNIELGKRRFLRDRLNAIAFICWIVDNINSE